MPAIDDILAAGGEIDVPGGFMRRAFELFVGGEKVSELAWEAMPSGRAFYDSGEVRYEITVPKKSRFTWKRTVQVRRAGEVAAELHSNHSGSSGDVITSRGRRYTFRSSRAGVSVTRDVGLEVVLTYGKRRVGGPRRIVVYPTGIEAEEFHALFAAVTSHLLARDYFNDASVAAAGASGGGGGG